MATRTIRSRDPIRNSEDTTQIIRRMPPLRSEPAIIVIKPPDHGPDIESAIDRVENIGCAWYSCPMWDDCAWDNWAEELCAFFETEGFEAAAHGVEEDIAGGFVLDWKGN